MHKQPKSMEINAAGNPKLQPIEKIRQPKSILKRSNQTLSGEGSGLTQSEKETAPLVSSTSNLPKNSSILEAQQVAPMMIKTGAVVDQEADAMSSHQPTTIIDQIPHRLHAWLSMWRSLNCVVDNQHAMFPYLKGLKLVQPWNYNNSLTDLDVVSRLAQPLNEEPKSQHLDCNDKVDDEAPDLDKVHS
ncbi:hypothetical protein ACH5RR_040979 [Cinchona calisaya]|uniref:Uncharacterized protein n=1 Tax=Cinchona calisaya TaxID=153742 RepID=A0ABD2XV97_9GENT